MTSPCTSLAPTRSRADTGWRRAVLLGLMLVTFVWMPLGARDAAGVSSVLPALRAVALAQPAGTSHIRAATAADEAPRVPEPAPAPSATVVAALLVVAVAALVAARRRPSAADTPRPVALTALGSRAPPVVH